MIESKYKFSNIYQHALYIRTLAPINDELFMTEREAYNKLNFNYYYNFDDLYDGPYGKRFNFEFKGDFVTEMLNMRK